jgi:uncharacterized protein
VGDGVLLVVAKDDRNRVRIEPSPRRWKARCLCRPAARQLTRLFGRGLGSLLTAGAAGGLAWMFTASLLLALGAAIAAVLLVGVFGVGTVLRGLLMVSGRGGGGWGGGGGGGGFSSGGGGDFGGGGASGRW